MAIGWYTEAFDSAISPWTTLGPLAIVISFSLLQEGTADYGRHKSDAATNNYPCVILTTSQEIDESEGKEHRDDTVNHGEDVKVDLRKAYFVPQSKTPTTPTTSAIDEYSRNCLSEYQAKGYPSWPFSRGEKS